jgi:hypothetical protein
MNSSVAWSNRVKAILFGLGFGLVFHTSGNWWKIFTERVPECGQPNCVADFAAIYTGAKLMWENPLFLYDPNAQLAYQNSIAPTERALPFIYPPMTAAVLSPLGSVTFSTAFLLITFVNLVLIGESLRLWIRFQQLTKDQTQWLMLFTLCNLGVHAVVFYGQTSALVLFLLTRHIVAQKQTGDFRRGLWAGLLCLKPQFLPIPWMVFCVNRKWRDLTIAGALSLLLILGACAWIGMEATQQYFQLARTITFENNWTNPAGAMHNWKALTVVWLPSNWQAYGQWLGSAWVIVALVYFNRQALRQQNGFVMSWIANVLAVLIVSPHLFTHDLALLIIPCALFLSLSKEKVPILVGLGLVALAALPAVNHLLPTSTAITLVLLLLLTFKFIVAKRPKQVT